VLEIAPKGGEAHQEMAGEGGPPGAKLAPLRHTAPSSRRSLTRWATICLVAAVLAFSGCLGGGEGGGTEVSDVEETNATDTELLARASAVLRTRPEAVRRDWNDALAYADLDTAREELELPGDSPISGSGRQRLLLSFAARPLFEFSTVVAGDPSLGSLGDVLDGRRIEVAVGTNFAFSGPGADEIWPWDVVVLRTRQPFQEIAIRLRREGYDEADGLLLNDRRPPGLARHRREFPFPAVGNAGEGVIVLGGSARSVRVALRGAEAELTPTAALLARLPQVARVASGSSGRCALAIGLGESAAPREGELVVAVDGEAQANRLLFAGRTYDAMSSKAEVAFGEATADGNLVSARFTSTDEFNPTRLPVEDVERPYDCP